MLGALKRKTNSFFIFGNKLINPFLIPCKDFVNKIDLLEVPGQVDFDVEKVKRDVFRLNKNIEIFPVSARTGKGFENWLGWLRNSVKNQRKRS